MIEIIISFIIIGISIIIYIIIKAYNKNKEYKILSNLNINLPSFNKTPFKILDEEDHVTFFLCLINKDFLSGQMNGMISYYNGETYKAVILIIEHCEPITSLFQLNDETILTSSADGTMKKIKILLNNENENTKKYLVEFVFYTNKEFIFKSIQIKNCDDIISCNISKELILWKKNTNNDNPLYKVEKILLKEEYIRDILQINEKYFITCGESLQSWNCNNYEMIIKLSYNCKGNNSLFRINDEYCGILLQKDGDILLFNNKTLSVIKIFNITDFTISCMEHLSNNILVFGIFDNKNKRSEIKQYIIEKSKENNDEIYLTKIKSEDFNSNKGNSGKGWQRINIIKEVGDKIFIGSGGENNIKYFGKLIIFNKN